MSFAIRRILFGLLLVLILMGVVLAVTGVVTVRRSFPQTRGDLRLDRLDGPVDIYRDNFGIPQIYASTTHDLFFAQGYVHAQDRFWQMDFWRHIGSGRLAEMFGEDQVDTDRFLRTLGWARVAQEELENMDTASRKILQSYAEGVNAYLAGHRGSSLSLEYTILRLINAGYRPEVWQPLHSQTWAKVMAWDLGGNMDSEISRAVLLKELTPEQVNEIVPDYPADTPVIVAGGEGSMTSAGQAAGQFGELAPVLRTLRQRSTGLSALTGPGGAGIGSNDWVLSGERTASGKPLLANDPHLGVQMPSIWYQIGLHCTPKGPDCPYEVSGFSFAGAPGVIIGHNDRIAWGFTNANPDVQDLYIEKINPDNPDQYEANGQWVDMDLVEESIEVAGGDPIPITIRYTRHGPVVSDTYGSLEDFEARARAELPGRYAIALRWTALEPAYLLTTILKFNQAGSWDEFREAAREFAVPAQSLAYADIDGNIGYQLPGKIPMRANGDGTLPVPGWTDEYEWTGYIPFEELPFLYNPPQGFIVTANNPVAGPDYPYLISTDWDYGFRARRVLEMIEEAPGPIGVEYAQQMQGDNKNLNAETLAPVLLSIPLEDERLEQRRAILQDWDLQNHMNSAPAVLFEVFWRHLLADTFQDDLPEEEWPQGGGRWMVAMAQLVEAPDSPWWDNRFTSAIEGRDEIFRRALGKAVDELESSLGRDPQRWAWGDLHTVTFRNATLGESGIAPIEALFNRGPLPSSGGQSIVNATSWDATAERPYEVDWLPSMRMIVDLSDLQNSRTINTTGQSGHAYHRHYFDQARMWRNIQYHSMHWERAQIEANAVEHLRLGP